MTDAALNDLAALLSARSRKHYQRVGERDALVAQLAEAKASKAEKEEAALTFDQVSMLLNTMADERALEAQAYIEDLVTRGLQTIFDPTLSLVIATNVKGKTTTTEFLIRTELGSRSFETSVMDARGGGLVAVVGFLLRATILLLTTPEDQRFILLDETFAHVSHEYLEAVGMFLKELSEETNLQIVMVTHQDELVGYADKVYRFDQENGRTVVT